MHVRTKVGGSGTAVAVCPPRDEVRMPSELSKSIKLVEVDDTSERPLSDGIAGTARVSVLRMFVGKPLSGFPVASLAAIVIVPALVAVPPMTSAL